MWSTRRRSAPSAGRRSSCWGRPAPAGPGRVDPLAAGVDPLHRGAGRGGRADRPSARAGGPGGAAASRQPLRRARPAYGRLPGHVAVPRRAGADDGAALGGVPHEPARHVLPGELDAVAAAGERPTRPRRHPLDGGAEPRRRGRRHRARPDGRPAGPTPGAGRRLRRFGAPHRRRRGGGGRALRTIAGPGRRGAGAVAGDGGRRPARPRYRSRRRSSTETVRWAARRLRLDCPGAHAMGAILPMAGAELD